jgi:hypothetical protein
MNDKVWLLTAGSYSDFHIVGVYSKRENAENALQAFGGGDIEEYRIDPHMDRINAGLSYFSVHMAKNGSTSYNNGGHVFRIERIDVNPIPVEVGRAALIRSSDGTAWMDVECWARDEKHAVKIANEQRVSKIASGEWDSAENKR